MTTCIYWHRNDLRLHDNECLVRAIAEYDYVIPLYIVDPYHYRVVEPGFKKAGIIRYRYLCDTIEVLAANYKVIGGELIVRFGNTAEAIMSITQKYNVTAIIYQKEIASEELADEDSVRAMAARLDVKCPPVWGKTLYHLEDIPYSAETIPLTSKTFRINTSKAASPRPLIAKPSTIRTPAEIQSAKMPSELEIGYTDHEIQSHTKSNYPAGEDAAIERLEYYTFGTELLTSYKWTRNKSLGMDYSSKLSAFLALGSLSPRMIYHQVKQYESKIKKNISTWWLIFEVVWRDFFIFKMLRVKSAVFHEGGIKRKDVKWSYDKALFDRWKEGRTGIPFLDAHQRELSNTGFMSNRGRVNSASFFTRDYQIDWRWGAAWFEHCLIDYDVYANWMNWHTQAFEIYYTNPVHQAMKYDKNGAYTLSQIPELALLPDSDFHAPWLYTPAELADLGVANYAPPVEVYKKWTRAVNNIVKARK
ncbi:MAG: deoxyribodipyrimidine photo-lyase [Saprospiraceae bacterium]|jgi:deoxyribodipyrimidine photo-lyase